MGLINNILNTVMGKKTQPHQEITRKETTYKGISNPSGAVALNSHRFIVADDEDNDLRIYDRHEPGKSTQKIKLSKVFNGIIEEGKDLEIDLESGARIDGTYFWVGSHSTSKKGNDRPARRRLFAVTINQNDDEYELFPVGAIYTNLLEDLQKDVRFKRYGLDKARTIAPKEIGGLNIEGLAATPQKTLLLGFRNPLVGGRLEHNQLMDGKALVVELLNPFEVLHGLPAEFAEPLELDLVGFGIREITWRKDQQYLIVAGPYHANDMADVDAREDFRLYEWHKDTSKIALFTDIELQGFNVEAAFFYPESNDVVHLLSDDGKMGVGDCFRSREVHL